MLSRLAPAAIALTIVASVTPAFALPGGLTQLHGKAGCVTQQNAPPRLKKDCAMDRFAGNQMWDLAVSPDGRNLYVASIGGAVSVMRIRHGGQLDQLPGKAGCFSRSGSFGCTRVPALSLTTKVVVSPEGRRVYVGSADAGHGGVVIFERKPKTGALHLLGCVGENGRHGCASLRTPIAAVSDMAVTPDGQHLYVASGRFGQAQAGVVVVLRRTGHAGLSQIIGRAGCINSDGSSFCTPARGLLKLCCGVAVGPHSDNLYLSSSQVVSASDPQALDSAHFALAAFSLDRRGVPSQLQGPAGCVNQDGSEGCTPVAFRGNEPENTAGDIVLSPNGRNLYLAHSSTYPTAEAAICGASFNYIAMFPRDPVSGALGVLRQDAGACGSDPLLSPDGNTMYAVTGNFGNEVSIFSRDRATGLLAGAGCIDPYARDCGKARHLTAPSALAITPSGRYAYIVSDDAGFGETIGVFRRAVRG